MDIILILLLSLDWTFLLFNFINAENHLEIANFNIQTHFQTVLWTLESEILLLFGM